MAPTLAVPFHLALIDPIDEAAITGYPVVEGAYDPVGQTWRLPDGTLLTDQQNLGEPNTRTTTLVDNKVLWDDDIPE